MRNADLEEAQAGIKIAGRNINNLSYVCIQMSIYFLFSFVFSFSSFLSYL